VTDSQILVGGAILLLAVVSAVATRRLRFPLLVTFLALGMLLGSDGLGGIYFDNVRFARSIGIIGLIAILFEGGLTTSWHGVRPVLGPAFVLATLGVVITTVVTAFAAAALFDLTATKALLLGAIVGSTDAAAVFSTLRFTRLSGHLRSLLGAESGLNDPMAVALTLGFIAWIQDPTYGVENLALLLVRQLGLGLVIGLAAGYAAAWALPKMPSELAPFAAVASVGVAATSYGLATAVHASGFLAVYLVAVRVGNTPMPLRRTIVTFHEGLAFLAQVALFIVLGLLVFPHRLGSVALAGLALAAVLVFVARPIAVALSLVAFRFSAREQAFVAWAGLRGAVPIVLATFALSAGISDSATIFDAVFFVVLVSTVAQGLTLEPLAHRLGLVTPAAR
jgi:potassium/hydrogen antiporter